MASQSKTLLQSDLQRLSQAGAISDAAVVAGPEGWQVMVQVHRTQYPIAAKRGGLRSFRRLETAVAFLQDAGLGQFRVDARGYDRQAHPANHRRPDAAAALRHAHEAAAHDAWFRGQVQAALREADDPATEWVAHEVVKIDLQQQRTALQARIQRLDAD